MRDLEIRRRDNGFAEKQDVEVDRTRAFGRCSFAAQGALDPLNVRQQLTRKEACFGFDHLVQKPGLAREIPRFRFVDRGYPENAHIGRGEPLSRVLQVGFSIAEIRTQR